MGFVCRGTSSSASLCGFPALFSPSTYLFGSNCLCHFLYLSQSFWFLPGTVRACGLGAVQARGQRPGTPGAGGPPRRAPAPLGKAADAQVPSNSRPASPLSPPRFRHPSEGKRAPPHSRCVWVRGVLAQGHIPAGSLFTTFLVFFFFLFNKGHILLRQA